ncbi:MAG: CHAD domain-containing protein [Synechococcales cyanobacterium T60_A2020_003]|nr:CHAD domain-containing protein [Synechococcales cyanobacterium T60_A2020_003]
MEADHNGATPQDPLAATTQPCADQPISLDDTFGDYAYGVVQKTVNRIVKYEAAVLDDRDPEPLHQMRVGMRRLRAALHLCNPALQMPKAAGDRTIQKMSRCLGALRDLDVLIEKLQQYHPAVQGKARKALNKIIAKLQKHRHQSFAEVEAMLKGDRYHRFKSAYTAWLNEPQYRAIAAYPVQTIIPDVLAPGLSALLLHPGWLFCVIPAQTPLTPSRLSAGALHQVLTQHGDVLHDLRKQIKRVRYQMEFFKPRCPQFSVWILDFKAMQDALGLLQDCAVLRSTLSAYAGKDWDQPMAAIAHLIQHDEINAWQQWQPYQAQFLRADYRTQVWSEFCALSYPPRIVSN